MSYIETEIEIKHLEKLLEYGFEIEVDSPDGFIPVVDFIKKQPTKEYVLSIDDKRVSCSGEHLFETDMGWRYAKDLVGKETLILTNEEYKKGSVVSTENIIPIVDIMVDHPNHRYYTNGISSHNTGVGKSLVMCHIAASYLSKGKNVLYITLEMSEEKIAERIDSNLTNIPIKDLETLTKDQYMKKINKIKSKTDGKLIIKEYPTSQGSSANFRYLINELKLKKGFKPDAVFIDYINICASARIKPGGNASSYTYVKAIAEELRGLAVEFGIPIISATQTTRGGANNSDIELTDTSECIYINEKVFLRSGEEKCIKDLGVADQIVSHDGYKTILQVHHSKIKECVRLKLKSGKTVIVSKDHVFPTHMGRLSVKTGLKVGCKLNTR